KLHCFDDGDDGSPLCNNDQYSMDNDACNYI
ncbi:unnamed protein product, partial [Rotaria sp. Silwood1]